VAAAAVAVAASVAAAAVAVAASVAAAATSEMFLLKILVLEKKAIAVTTRTTTKIDALRGLDLLFQCLVHHLSKPFVCPLREVQTIG
jgi:hypothetical protein